MERMLVCWGMVDSRGWGEAGGGRGEATDVWGLRLGSGAADTGGAGEGWGGGQRQVRAADGRVRRV